jgi:hypothetical protein
MTPAVATVSQVALLKSKIVGTRSPTVMASTPIATTNKPHPEPLFTFTAFQLSQNPSRPRTPARRPSANAFPRPLSNATITKTIRLLAAILKRAVEVAGASRCRPPAPPRRVPPPPPADRRGPRSALARREPGRAEAPRRAGEDRRRRPGGGHHPHAAGALGRVPRARTSPGRRCSSSPPPAASRIA